MVYACRTDAGASCRVSRLRYNGIPAYTKPQMCRMPNQIVDQNSGTAHTQSLVDELHDLVRRQVMNEKTGAHQIEAAVREGKCQSVASDRPSIPVLQMRRELDPASVVFN